MALATSHALTLGDVPVRQLDGLFSLNDLHRAAGGQKRHQPSDFLRLDQTKALVAEIGNAGDSRSWVSKEGRNGGTYACRELVIAYAAWISPAFHLRVIRVFLAESAPAPVPAPAPTLRGRRWLIATDDQGNERLWPVGEDAFVTNWAGLVRDVASGERERNDVELAGMVDACLQVLARRQARKRRQPVKAGADTLPAQVRPLFNQALARLCADAHAHITPWALQRLAHGCNLDHPANLEQRAGALLNELHFEDWLSQGETAQARALVRFFEIGGQLAAESLARLQQRQIAN